MTAEYSTLNRKALTVRLKKDLYNRIKDRADRKKIFLAKEATLILQKGLDAIEAEEKKALEKRVA